MNDNETNYLSLTDQEAGDLSWALETAAEAARRLGEELIYKTFSKSAGFNQFDRAERLIQILNRLDEIFPQDEEDE